jgi:hypothetical protein
MKDACRSGHKIGFVLVRAFVSAYHPVEPLEPTREGAQDQRQDREGQGGNCDVELSVDLLQDKEDQLECGMGVLVLDGGSARC